MGLTWSAAERDAWTSLHRHLAGGIQQHWAYGECLQRLGLTIVRRMLRDGDRVVGLAQFGVRRALGLLPVALASEGPLFDESVPDEARREAMNGLSGSLGLGRLRLTLVSPDDPEAGHAGLGGRRALITGQATVIVDLTGEEEQIRSRLKSKWRNSLAGAEASPLRVVPIARQGSQLEWLLERDVEQQQRRGYAALPPGFVTAWRDLDPRDAPGADLVALRAEIKREPVAAMLFLCHGRSATYHIGWSDDRGREHDAHNLLLWHGIRALRDKGVEALDMGGVNTQRGAGIARFKLGTGGEVRWRAGTFSI
jgi:hypothetical protein